MSQPDQTLKANRKQLSDAVERILVRSTNWLGDSVMTLPALGRLRNCLPAAHICVLTKPSLAPLFELSGLVDAVIPYVRNIEGHDRSAWSAFRTIRRRLKQESFTTALLFQNAFEAALLAAAAGIPRRIGFATQGRRFLLTHPLERPHLKIPRHETFDYLQIVDAAINSTLDGEPESRASLSFPSIIPTELQKRLATTLLRENGVLPGEGAIAVLNPGATNSRAKCWPAHHFAELADGLIRNHGSRIVLVGSGAEREISSNIESLMREGPALNLAGLTDLATLIGVLSLADIVISNDTGTAHLASALGRSTMTIFGPTNEFSTAPQGPRSEIVRAPGIECERCMLRECPIDHRCMTRISPDDVLARVQTHLP